MDDTACALWLIPADEDAAAPAAAIRRYSRRLSKPAFRPHITLLSGLEGPEDALAAVAADVAASTAALRVVLGRAAHSEAWFRCVFLPVQDNGDLAALRRRARELLGTGGSDEDEDEYRPHLSLIYGALRPRQRQAIATAIGERLAGAITLRRLCLYRASSASPPEAWREIGGWALGRRPEDM